jgi:L-galactose dehydrogenase
METHPLGRTGLAVAPVALGTGSIGELFGPVSREDAIRVVHQAIDLGVNLIDTSTYYGSAEERLGAALRGRRHQVILATKAGRFGFSEFDFSPRRIRASLEHSLSQMKTDYVDIFHLHDVEYASLDPVLLDGFGVLCELKAEGKCRFVGMSGYPLKTIDRVIRETEVDVVLTYAKATLLDSSLTDQIVPLAAERGCGVINAAAVSLGLLTPNGTNIAEGHPATPTIIESAARMRALASELGVDISFLANQYSIWRSGAATTVVGVGKVKHLKSAIDAAAERPDPALEAKFLALRPPADERQWTSGLPENN